MGMNKKLLAVLIVLFTGLVFTAVGVLTAADVPDEFKIENKGYKKDKKKPVSFHHKKHAEEYKAACTDCHHEYEGDKNVWKEGQPVKKCSACHDPKKKSGKVMKLQNAYHRNCKDCHKKLNDDKKAPFKKCTGCHAKK